MPRLFESDYANKSRESWPICSDEFMVDNANSIAVENAETQTIGPEENEQINDDIMSEAEYLL